MRPIVSGELSVSEGPPRLARMTEVPVPSQPNEAGIRDARAVLTAFGVTGQSSRAVALTLLALADMRPGRVWAEAAAPLIRTVEIMAWIKSEYGIEYNPNSRETIRDSLIDFRKAGLVAYNPDDPNRPVSSARTCYQLHEDVLNILRGYGSERFACEARSFADAVAASQARGRDLAGRDNLDAFLGGLVESTAGLRAAESAVIDGRRRVLVELRALATAPGVNETAMQAILQDNYWIFGGQYVAVSPRRDLVPMQQHDILLVGADRSLTIIELKGPLDPLFARPRENHLTVSAAVNDAVGQCMNYLRAMDEFSLSLTTRITGELGLDYDFRTADAVVVIGHQDRPGRVPATREQMDQVLRMYNSHLSRIKVKTYADLIDAAERALQFDA